jgi:hypothetical protein
MEFILAKYRFVVDADGVKFFADADTIPFLLQPNWPNGDAWETGEAESWAGQKLLELTDVDADLAGNSRDQHPRARPILLAE